MAIEVTAEQHTDEWYAARLGIPTASEYKNILAKLKSGGYSTSRENYKSRLVIEQLTGVKMDSYSNAAMDWGSTYEDVARNDYMVMTGSFVKKVGFWRHDTIATGASSDGFVVGTKGGVEIKCPMPATHIATLHRGDMPPEHMPQVQGQMWICELDWVDFISYDPRMPEHARLFVKRIFRDQNYIDNLEKEIKAFNADVEAEVAFVNKWRLK